MNPASKERGAGMFMHSRTPEPRRLAVRRRVLVRASRGAPPRRSPERATHGVSQVAVVFHRDPPPRPRSRSLAVARSRSHRHARACASAGGEIFISSDETHALGPGLCGSPRLEPRASDAPRPHHSPPPPPAAATQVGDMSRVGSIHPFWPAWTQITDGGKRAGGRGSGAAACASATHRQG